MKKNWIHFLPDAYILRHRAEELSNKLYELERLQKAVENMKKEIEFEEDINFTVIRKDWSIEEISEAKQKAKKQI